jgi:hypothetical protein
MLRRVLASFCQRRRAVGVGAWSAAAIALIVAGCGGSAASSSAQRTAASAQGTTASRTTTASTSAGPPARPARRHRPRPRGAPVGSTLRVNAGTSMLSVTVTKVLDPLGDGGAALVPGTRAVGVLVTIRNDAGATYDSTASGDLSVVTSAGTASPLFIRQGVCQTPLTDFESLISVGEAHAGCVGFAVARHARVVSIRFSPHSRAPGSVTWR